MAERRHLDRLVVTALEDDDGVAVRRSAGARATWIPTMSLSGMPTVEWSSREPPSSSSRSEVTTSAPAVAAPPLTRKRTG